MATTTNYAWETPDDTDLVKDGAAAIRTLGSSIDTTTKALNPSTTLGDIEYRSSTANTNTRLGIGSTGQVLTVSGGVPAWSTPAVASSGLTYLTGTSFSAVSSVSLPNSTFTSTYTNYLISFSITSSSGANDFGVRGRTSGTDLTTNVYDYAVNGGKTNSTTYTFGGASADRMYISSMTAATPSRFAINVFSPETTDNTYISTTGIGTESSIAATANAMGIARSANQFDALTFLPSGGTITGFYRVYGIANS